MSKPMDLQQVIFSLLANNPGCRLTIEPFDVENGHYILRMNNQNICIFKIHDKDEVVPESEPEVVTEIPDPKKKTTFH